jgi:hypothetical protein
VRAHFETAVKIVAKVPLFGCQRVWGLAEMEEQGRRILEHATALLPA